jgi:hypothetical protein
VKSACLRALLLALLAALLSSCSALRLAYNNSQGLVRFEADRYFDFDETQESEFRDRLARYYAWHRETELLAYVSLLQLVGSKAANGIAEQDVVWAIAAMRERYHAAAAKAIEDGSPMLVRLRERQFKSLEKKLAQDNRKHEKEFLAGDAQRAHRNRTKRMWERVSDWTGNLSDAQEARIERFVREHARYSVLRFEDRKRVQRDAIALMKQYHDAAELAPRLAALITAPQTRRSEEYRLAAAHWELDLAVLLVDLDRSLTAEQRARVVKRVEGFAEDFRVLAGELAAAPAAARN